MPKKISITFLFTMVFTIVALFAATQVLAGEHPQIKQTGSYFSFIDKDKKPHTGYYEKDRQGNIIKIERDGKPVPQEEWKSLKLFRFCVPDKDGKVTIEGKRYSCHRPIEGTNEAGFVGNSGYCPWLIDPPGIVINLCP